MSLACDGAISARSENLSFPPETLGERQDKLTWQAAEAGEAMVTIERLGLIVLGIDDKSEHHDLGSRRTAGGIPEQQRAKPLPAIRLIDRQPTEPRDRHRGIARQPPGQIVATSPSGTPLADSV